MSGIKSQDLVVLLKLVSLEQERLRLRDAGETPREGPHTVRDFEMELGISKSEVNSSIRRSLASGLAIRDREDGRLRASTRSLLDFIRHGLKFVFPAAPGAMTRGMPTAFAAPMLETLLVSAGRYIYVWPTAEGDAVGQAVKPLFRSVPAAARQDPRLYEYLALVDAVRLGGRREADLAGERLAGAISAR